MLVCSQAMDQQWRRQWQAIEAEEASRMDPLAAGLSGRREGPVPPLSDLAISEDQDSRMRQQRREEKQTAAMQAAIKTAEANKAAAAAVAAASRQQTSHGPPSFSLAAELSANDDAVSLPLPPAQRPGSVPIVIPTALAVAAALSAPAAPAPTSGFGSRKDTDTASASIDQDAGRAAAAHKSISAAVGGATIDMLHEISGGSKVGVKQQSSNPVIQQAVGKAVLDGLQSSRDAGMGGLASSMSSGRPPGPPSVTIKQGEQPRPSVEPGTNGIIGAAALDLLREDQAGATGPSVRMSLDPGTSSAVGSVILDELKQQRAVSTAADKQLTKQQQQPSQPEARSVSGAVGAAMLDVLHDQLGQPLPRQRTQPPGVEAVLGTAVLNDLQVGTKRER